MEGQNVAKLTMLHHIQDTATNNMKLKHPIVSTLEQDLPSLAVQDSHKCLCQIPNKIMPTNPAGNHGLAFQWEDLKFIYRSQITTKTAYILTITQTRSEISQ